MEKVILIAVVIGVILCIGIIVFSEQISILFSQNKPNNIIYCYPLYTTDNNIEVSNNSKIRDYVCFYDDGNGVGVKCLRKEAFLNYRFSNNVITNYVIEDGKIKSAYSIPGKIPSKSISIKNESRLIEINCTRAITIHSKYINNNLEINYRNIMCCKISGKLSNDVIFIAKNGNKYKPIFKHILNNKNFYVFDVDQDDLIILDEITETSFIINSIDR